MPNLADLQNRQNELIRKALDGSVFIAPTTAADIAAITTYTAATTTEPEKIELAALPADYKDAGYITKDDGVSWSVDVDTSDTTSMGAAEPTRRDIVSKVTGMGFTMQETNKRTLELYHGRSIGAADANSGEVTFDDPSRPATVHYKVLSLHKDGEGADAIYIARFLPRCSVTDISEQTWSESDEIRYGVTLTAYTDSTLGTSVRHFFGGPGWKALLTKMGF
jgi:hypothetical protein